MQKYFLYTISLIAISLLGLFGFFLYIFSGNLKEVEESQRRYTLKMSHYIENYFQKEAYTLELSLDPNRPTLSPAQIRNEWLHNFSEAAGVTEISIVDSLGLVFATTSKLYPVGSWILSSSRDSASVDKTLFYAQNIWTNYKDRERAVSRMSYHRIKIDGERHILLLKSNHDFIAQTEQFRKNITIISAAFGFVLLSLLFLLHHLQKSSLKAVKELQKSEKLAFLGQTSAELAHELKNPLAIIKSSAEALMRNPKEAKKVLLLEFISEEVMKMSHRITNILNFNRETSLSIEEISPFALLTHTTVVLKSRYPNLHITLSVPKELIIKTDKLLFSQIAENLIQNAVNELQGKGKILIEATIQERYIELSFFDSGRGVPENMKERLFEPFVSGSRSGTGLGLAIIHNICNQLGWEIKHSDSSSKNGFSTCFKVIIPKKR